MAYMVHTTAQELSFEGFFAALESVHPPGLTCWCFFFEISTAAAIKQAR